MQGMCMRRVSEILLGNLEAQLAPCYSAALHALAAAAAVAAAA
jgi:hypothetical protein